MALPTKEEISVAIESGNSIHAIELSEYEPVPGIIGPESYSGGFCIVFPFMKGSHKKAVRVWHQKIDDIHERYKILAQDFKKCRPSGLINIEYVQKGLKVNDQYIDITIMDWVDGVSLKEYILQIHSSNETNEEKRRRILLLVDELQSMFLEMHNAGYSHGDLQHENIIVSSTGQPILIDYDCFYTPSMKQSFRQSTSGYDGYQHPTRFVKTYYSNQKTDYFSELVINISLLAIAENLDLIRKYNLYNSDLFLFKSKDFQDFKSTAIYKELSQLGHIMIQYLDVLLTYLSYNDIDELNYYADYFNDEVLWKEAYEDGSESAFKYYITNTKLYDYLFKAYQELEKIYFAAARRDNTYNAYCRYFIISNQLKSEVLLYSEEVINKFKCEYNTYLELVESNQLICQNERNICRELNYENQLWANAERSNSVSSYRTYLQTSRIYRYRYIAIQRIDDALWKKAEKSNNVQEYKHYLDNFPSGRHTKDAKFYIASFEAKQAVKRKVTWIICLLIAFALIFASCIIYSNYSKIRATETSGTIHKRTKSSSIKLRSEEIVNIQEITKKIDDLLFIYNDAIVKDLKVLLKAETLLNDLQGTDQYLKYKKKIDKCQKKELKNSF